MKLVYIAGALRSPDRNVVEDNISHAEIAGIQVACAGAMPIVPHAMTRNMGDAQTDRFWLEGTAELLRRCDAMYLHNIDHVETSAGTRAEVDVANQMRMPVFIDLGALAQWIEWQKLAPVVSLDPDTLTISLTDPKAPK